MHAAAISPRGGVAPKTTRLRGQGLIEYVLIAAVIGLVVVFAGPQVSGAIRNQFNQVSTTLDSGTDGGIGGGASGGSTGADSATVQAAVAKDARDWTLDEQKAVAEDIAAKGEASPAYAKAMAAMDAGTTWSVKLTNGETIEYRIIGINHDDLTDGSGKAGLTFLTTSTGIRSCMNATKTNAGGWEQSDLRRKMNSGEIWNLMPSDFQSKVKPVRKLSHNVSGYTEKDDTVTATTDNLFLLSYSEIVPISYWVSSFPWTSSEGTQYEGFRGKVKSNYSSNSAISIGSVWWERSVSPGYPASFLRVNVSGGPLDGDFATTSICVCPVWCF